MIDPKNPPKASQEDLQRFDALNDGDIDYSDIPELDSEFWDNARVVKPRKKPTISLRLSEDIIDFFKADSPKGYTGRMAMVLAAYVEAKKREQHDAQPDNKGRYE